MRAAAAANTLKSAETVVVMPYHLRLIQRKPDFRTLNKAVADKSETVAFKLLACPEKMRIICHIKHAQELHFPGVFAGRFVDEDGHTAVDFLGQFSVVVCAEYGEGSGVGVEESEVVV